MLTTFQVPTDSVQSENRISFKKTLSSFNQQIRTEKVLIKDIAPVIDYHLSYNVGVFVSKYLMNFRLKEVHLFDTRCSDKVILHTSQKSKVIVNFRKVNDYRRINRFFEDVNTLLPKDGLFISSVETHTIRKNRILVKIPKPLKGLYYTTDFFFHRIIPKLKLFSALYFKSTKGRNRVLTRAEALGRLYACGFSIVEDKIIDGRLYFVAKKTKDPSYDLNATYGPFIQLKRVGMGGKIIQVFKLRTMHPYAEHLQHYIYTKNNLRDGGKIKNDFRISRLGRTFRKYWLDELPMLINLFKGDLKLIGTRPLSQHYFDLYPKSLQLKRTKFKPGLLPPFYADLPKTLDEIIKSEQNYLEAYEQNPLVTDIKYFFKILNNILFAGKRSG
jgi:lipopolysaccharide/colanic/teichoic acid biosynthesis glycosyltransferase